MFGIRNLYDPEYADLVHRIQNALRANYIMEKNVDYVVQEGQVIIVDQFTGRLMIGRQYSEGLHQALEAKEQQMSRDIQFAEAKALDEEERRKKEAEVELTMWYEKDPQDIYFAIAAVYESYPFF